MQEVGRCFQAQRGRLARQGWEVVECRGGLECKSEEREFLPWESVGGATKNEAGGSKGFQNPSSPIACFIANHFLFG